MVAQELLIRPSDVKIAVIKVEADLVLVDAEPLRNEFDDKLADIALPFCDGSVLGGRRVCIFRRSELDDEEVLVGKYGIPD